MKEKKDSKSRIVNDRADILLINPPFGIATNPYIAIPVLASYLKSRSIKVEAYDLNREFFYRLLTPQRIQEGIEHCLQRFDQLNSKPALDFQQVTEMRLLTHILSQFPLFQSDIKTFSQPFADFNVIRRSRYKNLFIIAATMSYFPEFIVTHHFPNLMSSADSFSSRDILNSVSRCDFYTNTFEEIIKEEFNGRIPQCVGFSVVFSSQIIPAFQCAKIIRDMAPGIHITMGGPCISIFFREMNIKAFFDIVDSFILDEGEIPLEILCRELSKKKPVFADVPGLLYISGDKICRNPTAPPVDMKKSPPPDYTVFNLHKYLNPIEKMTLSLPLSKGCYWSKCSFCRTRLPMTCNFQQPGEEVIYKHLMDSIEHTGVKKYHFSDEASNPQVLEYISRNLIKDKIKITWRAHGKVSRLLTYELCRLFKDTGCVRYFLGVESLSDRILKLMKKGISAGMIDEVLKEINGIIPVGAYMMMGYPTETEAEILDGYKKIMDYQASGLLAQFHYSIFCIAYGSDIWNNPEAHGVYDIRIPEGQDLLPDIYDFKSSGIARGKVHLHFNEFSEYYRMIKNPKNGQLHIGDRIIPFRYNLSDTLDIDEKNWQVIYMPFVRWLREVNKTFTPLKPLTPV